VRYRLGDKVAVRATRIDFDRRQVDLELARLPGEEPREKLPHRQRRT